MKQFIPYIFAIFCGVTTGHLNAQESGSHQHYKINYHLLNPAATGMNGHMIMLNYISRWNSFPGNPQTFTAGYNGMISEKIGLGALVVSDNLGSLNKTAGALSYAYQFDIEETRFSIGLSTGYERYKLQASALVGNGLDPGDPIIDQAANGYDVFDAAFGVHARLPDGFFAGVSLPNLIRTRVDSDDNAADVESALFQYFIGYAGYRMELPEYNFDFEPSLAIRKVRNAPFQADFNLLGYYADDQLIGGFTYSLGGGNAAHILLGTRIDLMTILYSYGVSFSDFQSYSNGSHEISLRFDLSRTEDENTNGRKRR